MVFCIGVDSVCVRWQRNSIFLWASFRMCKIRPLYNQIFAINWNLIFIYFLPLPSPSFPLTYAPNPPLWSCFFAPKLKECNSIKITIQLSSNFVQYLCGSTKDFPKFLNSNFTQRNCIFPVWIFICFTHCLFSKIYSLKLEICLKCLLIIIKRNRE